jgi:hypothetical protein
MGAPENVEFIPAGIIEGPLSRTGAAVVPAEPEREPASAPTLLPGADAMIKLIKERRQAHDA